MINKYSFMKSAIAIVTLSTASVGMASPSSYVGAQLGYGNAQQYNMSDEDSEGLAGRLFAGYRFNSYIAGELGWTKFANASTTYNYYMYDWQNISTKYTTKTSALDLVAKVSLPVSNKMNVYGKGGVAYVMASSDFDQTGFVTMSSSSSTSEFLPTFGFGANYSLTPKVALDVSYSRIQEVGDSDIDSTDFVGVGFVYSIG